MTSDDKEELKRKFREALEKKNAGARKGEDHLEGNSTIQSGRGPQQKREFRRKSGG
jgi:hypothetical protein